MHPRTLNIKYVAGVSYSHFASLVGPEAESSTPLCDARTQFRCLYLPRLTELWVWLFSKN